jgi:hypothetical protein
MKRSDIIAHFGTVGILLTAIASPCCFPLFGILLSAMGFGSFELFGGITKYVFLVLVVLSILGAIFSFQRLKKPFPIIINILSGILIFSNYYFFTIEGNEVMYLGMMGLLVASLMNYYESKIFGLTKSTTLTYKSIITCPNCGFKKEESMPTDACQFFYECENCKSALKPKQGDCCVFCSYGNVSCLSIQELKCC